MRLKFDKVSCKVDPKIVQAKQYIFKGKNKVIFLVHYDLNVLIFVFAD